MASRTPTESDQLDVEKTLKKCFEMPTQPLHRATHVAMLRLCIARVSEKMQGLDSSRPWLCYWILHAADILNALPEVYEAVPAADIAEFLLMNLTTDADPSDPASDPVTESKEQRKGFAGGPGGQRPHLAASYAAVTALMILQQSDALDRIDRPAVQRWLVSLRTRNGGFRLTRGGEVDIRATYCAAVVAAALNLDMSVVFPKEARDYVVACQTYEGGFASCLDGGGEAHGGYTQCALAACMMLGNYGDLNLDNLRRFCAMRQLEFEGGFCGRTNKLVDSCYSFWIGGSAVMSQAADAAVKMRNGVALNATELLLLDYAQVLDLSTMEIDFDALKPPAPQTAAAVEDEGQLLFDQQELLYYVLQCCQQPCGGGLRDKPSTNVDFYHTCYSLSGASIASNNFAFESDFEALRELQRRKWLPENPSGVEKARKLFRTRGGGGVADSAEPNVTEHLARMEVLPYPAEDALVGAVPQQRSSRGTRTRRNTGAGATDASATAGASAGGNWAPFLRPVNPVFNVCRDKVEWTWRHFRGARAPMSLLV
jgi:protein farnesyltransferase subunit beta